MAYTGTVMTENAFYPLFLLVVLLLALALERPTVGRQLAFLVGLALAFATRSQAVAFVPAALTAPLVLAFVSRAGLRATLRSFAPLYGVLVGGGLLVVALQAARGRSLSDLLGAYAVVGEKGYDVGGGAPLRALPRGGDRPLRRCDPLRGGDRPPRPRRLAATVGCRRSWPPPCRCSRGSCSSSRRSPRSSRAASRSGTCSSSCPLFVIALMAWLERGAPRPRLLAFAAAAASALLVLAIPFERFINTSAQSDTLMLLPWWSVQDRTGIEWVAELAFLLALAFAAAFLVVPARVAFVLPLVVLAYWAVTFKPIWFGAHGLERASAGAVFQGIRGVPRDWIDETVPPGEEVAVLWTGRSDRFTVNQNEFFNRRVGQVYYTTAPTPGGIGEVAVSIDEGDGVVRRADGSAVTDRYVLTDGSIEPDGRPVARDPLLGMTVWELDGPLVSTTTVTGLYANDTWSGPTVTWTRRALRRRHAHRLAVRRRDALPARPGRDGRDRRARASGAERAGAAASAGRACRRRVHDDLHRLAHRRAERRDPRQRRRSGARHPLQRLPLRAMRIVVDVSPLSHPRTGIGNYIRGSLRGLVEAAATEHEVVAFAPTSLRGPERIRAALDGIPVESRLWPLPGSHALRTAWSRAGRPAGRAPARHVRRPPLQRLDVPAAARWRALDDDSRPRAAALPRPRHAADACDAHAQVRARGADVRRDLRELRATPPRT